MRLKTFHAKSMAEAMAQVRAQLGADAIIVQSEESKGGVRIVAAIEAQPSPYEAPPSFAPKAKQTPVALEAAYKTPISVEFDKADVTAVLSHHGLPFETAERFSQAALAVEAASLPEAFSSALEAAIRFNPITDAHTRPIMLIGPPGAGKTICAAKLTADALIHHRTVHLISTDTVKAGGIQQLDHFAQLMKQTVSTAATPQELGFVIKNHPHNTALTVIDTPGTNAFDIDELETLLSFIKEVNAEPVLVMPAGLDPLDAQEIAGIFNQMGCSRFIATRLDAARRYAGILMAARPGYLSLAAISRSPFVADGLETATPLGLARLLTSLSRPRKKNNSETDKQP
ncbi:flagellar biosynthesis protein FlhF [Kordiimonas pumila]|uniref:GTPase n=1 Tax=Kordiimonas pumila TaxID=2161677 RepID=A0ABV7D6Y6_9PROT|nr:GTPase [Kordiimonas pumila]